MSASHARPTYSVVSGIKRSQFAYRVPAKNVKPAQAKAVISGATNLSVSMGGKVQNASHVLKMAPVRFIRTTGTMAAHVTTVTKADAFSADPINLRAAQT